MTWAQGRSTVERLLGEGRLQRVTPSRRQADLLLTQARRHLSAAAAIAGLDPPGAFQLTYDGARKALVAVLENQGLRPTHTGGHIVVYESVRAQLDPPLGHIIRPFNRMRRARNQSEYPSLDQPTLVAADVTDALARAGPMLDLAERVLDQMDAF